MMTMKPVLRRLSIAASLLAAGVAVACSDSISDHIIGVDGTGTAFLFLYLDNDLTATYNANVDTRLVATQIDMRMRGSLVLTTGGVTDTLALRVIRAPVGRYTAVVGPAVLGDSLEVESAPEFTVLAADSTFQSVALKFKTYSVDSARTLPTTRRGWVRGIVVNSPNTFGDSTVHLLSDTSNLAIRVAGIRPNTPVIAGDTVLFIGRRSIRDGQPIFLATPGPQTVIQNAGPPPVADSLSTAAAATAGGGVRDARFVRVTSATVADTVTFNGDKVLSVDDGSGVLRVVLSQNINFGTLNQYRPGAIMNVAGVLVPDAGDPGKWLLKPRARLDIVILP